MAASVFEEFAKTPTDEIKTVAARLWPLLTSGDFSECQMGCDDALRALGLLRDGEIDPRFPDEGPVPVYGPKSEP